MCVHKYTLLHTIPTRRLCFWVRLPKDNSNRYESILMKCCRQARHGQERSDKIVAIIWICLWILDNHPVYFTKVQTKTLLSSPGGSFILGGGLRALVVSSYYYYYYYLRKTIQRRKTVVGKCRQISRTHRTMPARSQWGGGSMGSIDSMEPPSAGTGNFA